jgi:hypothetical protein
MGHGVPAGFVVAAEVVRNLRIDVQNVGQDLAQASNSIGAVFIRLRGS